MSHLKILQPDFANRPGQDATAAHTTNTTTRRPEAMKRRGEKKRLVKAQQTYHMRADCKTLPNRTTTALQYSFAMAPMFSSVSLCICYSFRAFGRWCEWVEYNNNTPFISGP